VQGKKFNRRSEKTVLGSGTTKAEKEDIRSIPLLGQDFPEITRMAFYLGKN